MSASQLTTIPLPKAWNRHVKSAVLNVISLAQYATAYTRGWAADGINARARQQAEVDRLQQELAFVNEQLRIITARMKSVPARSRPHYKSTERMAILELKAGRGWSLRQTADKFLVTSATIASWLQRVSEHDDTLVQLREPVNKFPDFVRYAVQRLKMVCPSMGKAKIAEALCRAGLHLGKTTVGRILKEGSATDPNAEEAVTSAVGESEEPSSKSDATETVRIVTAKYCHHVWHVDLTTVPIGGGFWATWLPFVVPQCWPFCWWVAVVLDHHSRRCTGVTVFTKQPTSEAVRAFLGRTIRDRDAMPKYIICDKGSQFCCEAFKSWCQRRGIKPRFGAIGQHGSIAVVERFIKTLKDEATRRILVPLQRESFRNELVLFRDWYNEYRPHMTLLGKTPNEVYFKRRAANQQPRIEPRAGWPRGSPCAKPQTLVAGQPGDKFTLQVDFHEGRKHLPIVTSQRAA
ncbi:MAG: DDE-type integrase/transposase/recombinase [Planctomycetota bacterium]|nr:DDE-type integrase/transposase/recombinase [Planctomycetota bacterium]